MDYHRMNKVDIRIVRIFNTYGPVCIPMMGASSSHNFIRTKLSPGKISRSLAMVSKHGPSVIGMIW